MKSLACLVAFIVCALSIFSQLALKTSAEAKPVSLKNTESVFSLVNDSSESEGKANKAASRKSKPIISLNLPLTGELATYGQAVREGIEFAIRDFQGELPVQFDIEDNIGSSKEAVTIMRRQLEQDPMAYIVGVKPQAMAVQDELKKQRLPMFSYTFDTNLRPQGEDRIFRTWVSFRAEPELFLDYAKKRNAKRVAVLYVQVPIAEEEYSNYVIPGLKSQGTEELLVQAFPMETTDFRSIALKVKSFNPDLTIICGFSQNLQPLVREMNLFHLVHNGNTIGSYDFLDLASVLQNSELEGIKFTTPKFITRKNEAKTKAWYDRFEAAFNKKPLYTHAYAYDMAQIIFHAASNVTNESRDNWTKAIQATKLDGITGRLEFDEQGDLPQAVELGVFRNGEVVAALD